MLGKIERWGGGQGGQSAASWMNSVTAETEASLEDLKNQMVLEKPSM